MKLSSATKITVVSYLISASGSSRKVSEIKTKDGKLIDRTFKKTAYHVFISAVKEKTTAENRTAVNEILI